MKKGYTKSWRKELDSECWLMPPIYHRVWFWLRQKAQHVEFLFPTRSYGIWVLPGQRLTSLQEIADGVKWTEWGVEKIPNKKTIKSVLDYLEKEKMIAVESNAKGTLISIVNWDTYQQIECIESNSERTTDGMRSGHKKRMLKNVKECKEEGNSKNIGRFTPPTIEEVEEYCKERNKGVDPERFINFYAMKGWMVGKNKMKDWKAAVRTWEGNGKDHSSQQPKNDGPIYKPAPNLREK